MILVDIYVPAVEQTFDFSLDENCKISALLGEIQETIAQRERFNVVEDTAKFCLFSTDDRRRLHPDTTLADNGMHNGSRLIFI